MDSRKISTNYEVHYRRKWTAYHVSLERDKEISVLIKQNNEDFEGLGQLRDKNERGFGEATSIMNGNSELDVIKKILDKLLGYNLKRENK